MRADGAYRASRARGRGVSTSARMRSDHHRAARAPHDALAFYIGGLLVSVTAGVLLLSVFSDHRAVLGSSSSHPSPGSSIIAGLVAVLLAWLMASQRGRAEVSRWRDRHSRRRARVVDTPSWAERRLAGASATVAFAVGAGINLPGPFYVLALGEIASGGYSSVQAFGLVLLFNVVMFLLLEVPLRWPGRGRCVARDARADGARQATDRVEPAAGDPRRGSRDFGLDRLRVRRRHRRRADGRDRGHPRREGAHDRPSAAAGVGPRGVARRPPDRRDRRLHGPDSAARRARVRARRAGAADRHAAARAALCGRCHSR